MGNFIDISGQRFDKLVAIEYDKDKGKWLCQCDCGRKCYKLSGNLRRYDYNGQRKSCGCIQRDINLIGQKFNKLLVIDEIITENGKAKKWKCLCDCGNMVIATTGELRNKRSNGKCECCKKYKLSDINTGDIFGRLTVIKRLTKNERKELKLKTTGDSIFKCQCECGNITYVTASNLKYRTTTSCGCYNHEKISGKQSHFYKPELTDEDRKARSFVQGYDKWVKDVKEKANYKCEICGSSEKLHSHHKDGYHWCKDRRTDLTNGVCLCERCHKEFHDKYGLHDNTEQQYLEFLKSRG